MNKKGIYIHVPFCRHKCPYCDFYSKAGGEQEFDRYTERLCSQITDFSEDKNIVADTVYFGGGTPTVIGADRITKIIKSVRNSFDLNISEVEITVEVNPEKKDIDFGLLFSSGCNRISIGLQSTNDNELRFLGRMHNTEDAARCIRSANNAGFENISLDLMIALPGQTNESLRRSVDFCASHGAKHISAYILKVEEGTVFYQNMDKLNLPDDEHISDMYEYLCSLMKEYGYSHYEISNFCKAGYESKHNLKYWHDEEYIGFGPSSHSFLSGRRFYRPANLSRFYNGEIIPDGGGGDIEEFIMLGLRLSEGITNDRFRMHFGFDIPEKYINRAKRFEAVGLTKILGNGFTLTEKGFMVSNSLIVEILNA